MYVWKIIICISTSQDGQREARGGRIIKRRGKYGGNGLLKSKVRWGRKKEGDFFSWVKVGKYGNLHEITYEETRSDTGRSPEHQTVVEKKTILQPDIKKNLGM